MNICVCVKQVPASNETRLDPVTHTVIREGAESILNPFDAFAVEEAVRLKARFGGRITAFSMGIPAVSEMLRRVIAVGADEACLLSDRAFAGADTIASEIGVRDQRVYMITTFERTVPGVNGGVSVLGTAVSTVAALLIAVLGWFVVTESLDWMLLIPFAAGVAGNLLDSVFGALFENRGWISKYTNNLSTEVLGGVIGLAAYAVIA